VKNSINIPTFIGTLKQLTAQQSRIAAEAETEARKAVIANNEQMYNNAVGQQQIALLTGSILGGLGMALEQGWVAEQDPEFLKGLEAQAKAIAKAAEQSQAPVPEPAGVPQSASGGPKGKLIV